MDRIFLSSALLVLSGAFCSAASLIKLDGTVLSTSAEGQIALCSTTALQRFSTASGEAKPATALDKVTPLALAISGDKTAIFGKDQAGVYELIVVSGDGKASTMPLPQASGTEKLLWMEGKPVLLSGRSPQAYDLVVQSPASLDLSSLFGKALLAEEVFPLSSDFAVSIRPYKFAADRSGMISLVSAYSRVKDRWELKGSFSSRAPQYRSIQVSRTDKMGRIAECRFEISNSRLIPSRDGVLLMENEHWTRIPFQHEVWNPEEVTPNAEVQQPVADTDGILWGRNGYALLAGADKSTNAFMPWTGAGAKLLSVVPAGKAAWVISSGGASRFEVGSADDLFGWNGYVRVPMQESPENITPDQKKFIDELESWVGTPYKWGGTTREGCDCSGLVWSCIKVLGLNIPRTSADMRSSKMGQIVKDELRVGDVLTYPGHVAVYKGNGETIETVSGGSGGVGHGSIWKRLDVVVKRFLKDTR